MPSVIFSPSKTIPSEHLPRIFQFGPWDYIFEESQGFLGTPFLTLQPLVPRPTVNISPAASANDSIAARKSVPASCQPKTQMGKV